MTDLENFLLESRAFLLSGAKMYSAMDLARRRLQACPDDIQAGLIMAEAMLGLGRT